MSSPSSNTAKTVVDHAPPLGIRVTTVVPRIKQKIHIYKLASSSPAVASLNAFGMKACSSTETWQTLQVK